MAYQAPTTPELSDNASGWLVAARYTPFSKSILLTFDGNSVKSTGSYPFQLLPVMRPGLMMVHPKLTDHGGEKTIIVKK
ncbi:hypothetical protein [Phaeobacter sp. JH20_39]|uniref:hypothetical protein n=1 Tax=Phaeobacter sp. JH20_39 TaxID=3112496 RepID=UPI003A8A3A81